MQLLYTMFITNNCALFHLWLKENLVKYQKVSKYHVHDCRVVLDMIRSSGQLQTLQTGLLRKIISFQIEIFHIYIVNLYKG